MNDINAAIELDDISVSFDINGPDSGERFLAIDGVSGEISPRHLRVDHWAVRLRQVHLSTGHRRPTASYVWRGPRPGWIRRSPQAGRRHRLPGDSTLPWRSVLKNVTFPLEVAGTPKNERIDRARVALKKVGLDAFEDRQPAQLSGGMRQRVAIARALAQHCSILLMDEPFGALDAQTRRIVGDEVQSVLQENHLTVLFITHDIDEAIYLSDEVWLMSHRPGTLLRKFSVPLERPRNIGMLNDQAFNALRSEMWNMLSVEARRSFELAEGPSAGAPDA